jgi:rod shape-determining protein MreC
MPGVAVGNKEYVHVKYIPLWMSPEVGDEVVTSGLDKIFFAGIPVGKVIEVFQEESYQTAVVKPYAMPVAPAFYHIVK